MVIQRIGFFTELFKRGEFFNLWTDMKVNANELQVLQVRQDFKHLIQIWGINAEFIFMQPGGDVFMSISFHIGIQP